MTRIDVKSTSHLYHVSLGENIRFKLKQYLSKKYSSILIITDENVAELYLSEIKGNFSEEDNVYEYIIPSGEQSKNIEMFYRIQTEAIKNGLDRHALIIALGGGVVGDLAGFVASTYMRGIDYIQIPTTILAHDSSVGGKVAINHELGKNLIGSFYPPQAVVYDVETLHSLSQSEVRSGYAELIKEALIANEDFFKVLLKTTVTNLSNEQLQEQLEMGIKIKTSIVESDERESGVRMFLNLGHTLGHALEAELGYGKLTHGEAVAIGLIFAIYVSEKTFSIKLPKEELLNWFKENNYPLKVANLNADNLITKMKSDKKVVHDKIQMVLLKGVSEPIVVEIDDSDLRLYLNTFLRKMVEE